MEAAITFIEEQRGEVQLLIEKLRKALRDCKKRKSNNRRRRKRRPGDPPWLGMDTTLIFGGRRIYLDDQGRAQDAIDRLMDEAARGGDSAQSAADQAGTIPGGSRSGG